MRLDGIGVGDIVKVSIGGRVLYGEVLEIRDGIVYFNPISVGSGWRHASAHQILGHWRKAGRRRAANADDERVVQPPQQLSLRLDAWSGDQIQEDG